MSSKRLLIFLLILACRQDRNPPEVKIINPENGAVLSGTTRVIVKVKDDEALAVADITIDNKVVYVNEELDTIMTYLWDTDQEIEGSHLIIGYGRDRSENETADTVEVYCGKPPYPDSLIGDISLGSPPRMMVTTDRYLYVAVEGEVLVVDLDQLQPTTTIGIPAQDLDIDNSRGKLYIVGENKIYTVVTEQNVLADSFSVAGPFQGCFHSEHRYFLLALGSGGYRNHIHIIDLVEDTILGTTPDSFGIGYDLGYARGRIFLPDVDFATLWIIDTTNLTISHIPLDTPPVAIVPATSEREVYLGGSGVLVVSSEQGAIIDSIPNFSTAYPHGLVISPDGEYLFGVERDVILVASVQLRSLLDTVSIPSSPLCAAITPDGQKFLVGSSDGKVYIYQKR